MNRMEHRISLKGTKKKKGRGRRKRGMGYEPRVDQEWTEYSQSRINGKDYVARIIERD